MKWNCFIHFVSGNVEHLRDISDEDKKFIKLCISRGEKIAQIFEETTLFIDFKNVEMIKFNPNTSQEQL